MFDPSDEKAIFCDFKLIVVRREELRNRYLLYDSRGIALSRPGRRGEIPGGNLLSPKAFLWYKVYETFSKEMPVPIVARNIGGTRAFFEYENGKFWMKVIRANNSFKWDIKFEFNVFPEYRNYHQQSVSDPIFLGDDRILFFVLVSDYNDREPNKKGKYPKSVRKENLTLNFVGCMCFPGDSFPTYHAIFMHVVDANSCKQILFTRLIGCEKLSDPYSYPNIAIMTPSDKPNIVLHLNGLCPTILRPLCGIVIEYLIDFNNQDQAR